MSGAAQHIKCTMKILENEFKLEKSNNKNF